MAGGDPRDDQAGAERHQVELRIDAAPRVRERGPGDGRRGPDRESARGQTGNEPAAPVPRGEDEHGDPARVRLEGQTEPDDRQVWKEGERDRERESLERS